MSGAADQANYIELKELTRRVNNTELSVDNIGTAAVTDYDNDFEGLGSLTDYTALSGDPSHNQENVFIDEANNTVPYSQQKRGYGDGLLRLGSSICLVENIYSLAFIAELNNELIDQVILGDEDKMPEAKDHIR